MNNSIFLKILTMGNKAIVSAAENQSSEGEFNKKYHFEKRPVSKWEFDDLHELLEATGFQFLEETFFDFVPNGKALQNATNLTEIEEQISDPKQQYLFKVLIYHLRNLSTKPKEKFHFGFYVVLFKAINSMNIEVIEEQGVNYDDFISNCEVLSDKELMKESFLALSQKDNRVIVKIIITENIFTPRQIFARKLVSPIVNYFPSLRPEFGFFHTAIIIGGIYLEWTDSELVIPKDLKSSNVFLAFGDEIEVKKMSENDVTENECQCLDADPITRLQLSSSSSNDKKKQQHFSDTEICDILGEIIIKWNTKYRYKSVNSSNAKGIGNCQDFVKEIADRLNINLDPNSGSLRHFIEKIRKKGEYKLSFKVPEKMKNKEMYPKLFEFLSQKKYVFDSHRDLDSFVNGLYEANTAWKVDFDEEYNLLKAFDRAFWLRYFKSPDNEKYKPFNCAFEDPRQTKSFV